jgi:thiol-disulfide isomerase/thioredoxin
MIKLISFLIVLIISFSIYKFIQLATTNPIEQIEVTNLNRYSACDINTLIPENTNIINLVHITASWCEACQDEVIVWQKINFILMPVLEELKQKSFTKIRIIHVVDSPTKEFVTKLISQKNDNAPIDIEHCITTMVKDPISMSFPQIYLIGHLYQNKIFQSSNILYNQIGTFMAEDVFIIKDIINTLNVN